jgi:hypothetical protein
MSYEFIRKQIGGIREIIMRQNIFVRWAFYYGAIFIILILGIYGASYKATDFIYFQF